MAIAPNYRIRVESLRQLIAAYDHQVKRLEAEIHRQLRGDPGYRAIQEIPGVGPTFAAIFVAEIGDVGRFSSPHKLCSWAGLTPRHRQSDTKVTRGRVTKQGSRLLRRAAVEAVAKNRGGTSLFGEYRRIADRRGKLKARTAVARKLLILVYYGLRDGEIRSLRAQGDAA